MKNNIAKIPHGTMIMLGFLGIIIIGTVILTLPIASKDGLPTSFADAIFTATSATCVTGLVVADTYSKWTLFGQLVILSLIQIGGLGFITIGVYIATIFKKKISLKSREAIHESISTMQTAGTVRLTRRLITGTFIIEGIGAVLLATSFIPDFGIAQGIYYSIFHSISAFCNAGFDLMGVIEPYTSLTPYQTDFVVNITLIMLIIVGGLGFIVWDDIMHNKWKIRKYLLHSKIVLSATIVLLITGSIGFFILEYNHLLADMSFLEKVLAATFSSITPRTAGFNTIDTGALSNGSKLLTMIFMFIGGNSGSTAGGVKTTTMVVILSFAWSMIRRTQGINIFGRRLNEEVIKKANAVIVVNMTFVTVASMLIFAMQELNFEDVMFETFSAIGTAGMSTGITRDLNDISKIIVTVLMYFGRIGSLSFATAFAQRRTSAPVQQPVEKIVVG
ncbi:MAG: TrkH family potassium uptake protein [Eubacteriales bacterium]